MKIYDLKKLNAKEYEERDVNVFFQNDTFKTRVIALKPGGNIPKCQMDSFVIFYVVEGEVILNKNGETSTLKEDQIFITEPALLSMESEKGAKLMGIQIKTKE